MTQLAARRGPASPQAAVGVAAAAAAPAHLRHAGPALLALSDWTHTSLTHRIQRSSGGRGRQSADGIQED